MPADTRLELLKNWLGNALNIVNFDIAPASADASFRRYFRVSVEQQSWIAMDAPPDKEDCQPFVHVAQMIEAVGVQAPHIYHYDSEQGFMLLSDLGSVQYLSQLGETNADSLYRDAIDALIKMQTIENGLPAYDSKLLQTEMGLFKDWYIGHHLGIDLSGSQLAVLHDVFDLLERNARQQPQVFVHRDYHSRNLMMTEVDSPGVIDFQDAVTGPISYDLVSLLKDCYIAWPRQSMMDWLSYFTDNNPLLKNIEYDFVKSFELMGVQRHLKATGIFARLNHRDGKPGYLQDIPRTLAYIVDVCRRYDELTPMLELLKALNIQADAKTLELIR